MCTDDEIQLTAKVTPVVGGAFPYQLGLVVKNISSRTCLRDLGPDPQEMHIVQNGQTLWSSDSCQRVHGQPDVRTIPPGAEDHFTMGWNGTIGLQCNNQQPAPPGTYQAIAKLDTKISTPVTFSIR
jgi:hypothetical protein